MSLLRVVRPSSVCQWAILAAVIAGVLAESQTILEGDVTTADEDETTLLHGDSMSSRVKREYTNNRAARRRVFKQTDLNGDGLVTRREYVMRNGNMTEEELDILFGEFDIDGDLSLSQDEFVRHGFLWVAAPECELESVQRCDDEFVYLIRAAEPTGSAEGGQQSRLCQAFQTYYDCIKHEQVSCDMTAYSQAVLDLVITYRTVHFCPDLDPVPILSLPSPDDDGTDADDGDNVVGNIATPVEVPVDLSEFISSDQEHDADDDFVVEYRPKRADTEDDPEVAQSAGDGERNCTMPTMIACSAAFHQKLQRHAHDFCEGLLHYGHCLKQEGAHCTEFDLLNVKANLQMWLTLHRQLGIC
ncbi:uncharacterized protein [Diadema setosum]|uniref:uncharacterized protein n=1 Tax=Diadema setosum TaxID=31175 RepID=UPI003B3BE3E8